MSPVRAWIVRSPSPRAMPRLRVTLAPAIVTSPVVPAPTFSNAAVLPVKLPVGSAVPKVESPASSVIEPPTAVIPAFRFRLLAARSVTFPAADVPEFRVAALVVRFPPPAA